MSSYCGCSTCTEQVWETLADGFTCGRRILTLQSPDGRYMNKTDACRTVAEDYPTQCGLCHPITCPDSPLHCGCSDCSDDVWENMAGNFRCGDRINFLQTVAGGSLSQDEACQQVADQFLQACGQCHPLKCDNQKPLFCGCTECTIEDMTERMAGIYSCGDRIEALMEVGESEEDACLEVSTRFPLDCSSRCNPEKCDGRTDAPTFIPTIQPTQLIPTHIPSQAPTTTRPKYCECHKCTDEVWERPIRISSTSALTTCGDYIRDIMEQRSAEEANVCASVAVAYPACAACHPGCNWQSTASSTGGVSSWIWLFLGVVVFFVLMLYFLWKHFYKRKRQSTRKKKKHEGKKDKEAVPVTTHTTQHPYENDASRRIPDGP